MFNELLTKNQFQEKMRPLLEEKAVNCALCGKTMPRLTGAHLAAHRDLLEPQRKMIRVRKTAAQLETERNLFPGKPVDPWTSKPETLSDIYRRVYAGTSGLSALVDQTLRLYRPRRTEWLVMEHLPMKAEWRTVKSDDKGWPWFANFLNAERLKEHFMGQLTLGVRSHNKSSSPVMVFDVDGYQQPGETDAHAEHRIKRITISLVRLLRRHHLEPHVVASGAKGFHVCLYFDVTISETKAKRLFEYFQHHPELHLDGVNIELLPFKKAVKLPLGINWRTNRYCCFVEPFSLTPVPDPFQYFLDIQPMSAQRVLDNFVAEPDALKPRPRKEPASHRYGNSVLSVAYYDGIQAHRTRHNTTLQAAAYCMCHERPESEADLWEKMLDWSREQYTANREHITSPWCEHKRDLLSIVKYTWRKPLAGNTEYGVKITVADVHWIRSKTDSLATQRLLLAALYQSRVTGDEYHFGYERMRQLTGLAKDYLSPAIRELRDHLGLLKVVKNYSHQTGLFKGHTTVYKLVDKPDERVMSPTLVRITEGSWCPELWYHLLKQVFSVADLKELYRFSWHRIVQSTLPIASLPA